MRLSPSLTDGRKAWAITGRLSCSVTSSSRAFKPGDWPLTRITPRPARPPRGLSTISCCSSANNSSSDTRPATSVGAIQRLKRKAPSFSFQLRSALGRLSTRTPARSATSSRWVAYRYASSTGGSLRIQITSNPASA